MYILYHAIIVILLAQVCIMLLDFFLLFKGMLKIFIWLVINACIIFFKR